MRTFIALVLLLLCGCSSPAPPPPTTTFSGIQMTIGYHITIGHPLTKYQEKILKQLIESVFDETNRIYNKWNPASELSRLNGLKAGERANVSPELSALLSLTNRVVRATEGRFDPTIEPLQQLWKLHLEAHTVPDPAQLDAIKGTIGWDRVHFAEGVFWKDDDRISLDLGGIAKGYCVDLLVERIVAAGYPNVLVEWGGEMRAAGGHPDQRPWRIYITHLEDTDPDNAVAHLDLVDQAIATSGDYLQQWDVGGKVYYHIFDPKATAPLVATAVSICSVSVVAPTCALADALATAGMMFSSVEEAKQWATEMQERWPEATFWFVTRE